MPGNLEARVANLRKARSDQAVNSSRSTSKSTPVREPYSSWLERDGERVEEWLAEQKVDAARRRASVQEQTALAFLGAVENMPTDNKGGSKTKEGKKQVEPPKLVIERRRTTGDVSVEGSMLTGVGAFAGEETPRQTNPHLSFTFSQQEDEPMPDAPPLDMTIEIGQDGPSRS